MHRIQSYTSEPIPSTIDTLRDPYKIKNQYNQMFYRNTICNTEVIDLENCGESTIMGDEDVGRDLDHYQTTVQCNSQTSRIYSFPKEDFTAIQKAGPWWKILSDEMDKKLIRYSTLLLRVFETKNMMIPPSHKPGFDYVEEEEVEVEKEPYPVVEDYIAPGLLDSTAMTEHQFNRSLPEGAVIVE